MRFLKTTNVLCNVNVDFIFTRITRIPRNKRIPNLRVHVAPLKTYNTGTRSPPPL